MNSFERVLNGEAVTPPPIWLMRQAGRYLPEYRELRAKSGGFLSLCLDSEKAFEITMQPIRRFGFDAAILFADILLLPMAMGAKLWFEEGEGPRLNPIDNLESIDKLSLNNLDDTLSPVYETVSKLAKELGDDISLIGFAGAPWTVATYMVAGRGGLEQMPAREWACKDPQAFTHLIDKITEGTIIYLSRQIEEGAKVIKLFDSWAGSLTYSQFEQFCIKPISKIVNTLREKFPDAKFIGFPRRAGTNYEIFTKRTAVDAIAIDQTVSPDWARQHLSPLCAVQGNLDNLLLSVGGENMKDEVNKLLKSLASVPFIFNLGHGVLQNTKPENVASLIKYVRQQ